MVSVDRILLVAVVAMGAVSATMLHSLKTRIESLESRLAVPEVASAIARVQDKAAVEQLAVLTGLPRGGPRFAAAFQPSPAEPPPPPPLASVDEMVARLDARLKRNPKDAEGWRMLGWSYSQTGRYGEAERAYAKAIELDPKVAAFKSARGEALVKAANGVVTGEARQLFARALELDPKDPKARYFDGLVKEQAGDKTAALDEWIAIANEAGPDLALVPDLMPQISALGRDLGIDLSGRLQSTPAAVTSDAAGLSNAGSERTTPAATAAEETKRSSEQMTMIQGMVERLASRLDQFPRDADGWIRLIRSQSVLGEADKARLSRNRALKIFDNSPQDRGRIDAEARELGLTQ